MNYTEIITHLISEGFDAKRGKYNDKECLQIDFAINDEVYTLKHCHIDEIVSLPRFFLDDTHDKEGLAHILPFSKNQVAGICVTVDEAVSVNFEVPELAFSESLKRHMTLVEKAVKDPAWNKAELIREFAANWSIICETGGLDFICAATSTGIQSLDVKSEVTGSKSGFEGSTIGFSNGARSLGKYSYIKRQFEEGKRKQSGAGIIIPLGDLPSPPKSSSEATEWYLRAVNALGDDKKETIRDELKGVRAKTFWLIFNGNTGSGTAWFGLRLDTNSKKFLPLDKATIASWNANPVRVKVFNPESMLPRGGANHSLMGKRVLLVGCGSVGGEIAHKLGSSGVGELHLVDPDKYSWDNVYRHVLPNFYVGYYKSQCLEIQLQGKFPWLKTEWSKNTLLNYRDKDVLKKYDLIVIAIGSPTHERVFADYLSGISEKPAIINAWLEGYGVGGHVTLSLPEKKGCLLCAFVDNNSFSRGLASNLSFIEPNQSLTTNIAGCGDLFLPFSNIDAGKTASIAAELAIQHLLGRVEESCSVSWKGDDFEAVEHDIALTHRYYNFSESLVRLSLHHEGCDRCE